MRELIAFGAAALGIGFVVMALAPGLTVAIVGAAIAGVGNGVESVAARTALQEETDDEWMAMMMSLHEALFQSVPGAGIVLGGAITALGGPRAALAVAGAGSLAITAVAWLGLAGLGKISGAPPEPAPIELPEPAPTEPQHDPARPSSRRDPASTPAVRHQ
jgi:MFS family permease